LVIKPGDHAVGADAADDVIELGMHERLAAGNGDDCGAERAQLVDAAVHFVDRHGLGKIVELVAIGAGQIAAAHGDDVRQQRVVGRGERMRGHLRSADIAVQSFGAAAQGCNYGWHEMSSFYYSTGWGFGACGGAVFGGILSANGDVEKLDEISAWRQKSVFSAR
jgi:hypothetical protein